MEACARDFLQPLGVDHWKNNMGGRPEGGPTDDQLKALADTSNEIGRRTLAHGVKLALTRIYGARWSASTSSAGSWS